MSEQRQVNISIVNHFLLAMLGYTELLQEGRAEFRIISMEKKLKLCYYEK